jgi:hypothetical protein
MSKDLVNVTEKNGRQIYQDNPHFRRLANVMEHPEFREFYNTYMTDWDSAKMIIMFMKMYEAVEKHSEIELTPYQKLSIVKDVIDDTELRQKICDFMTEWCQIKQIEKKLEN